MSRFCTNCGKPLSEGSAFCTNCGAKVDPQPAKTPEAANQPQQKNQQYPQTPQPQASPNPQPPKRKKTGLIIGLSIGGTLTLIAVIIIALVVVPLFKYHGNIITPTESFELTEWWEATDEPIEEATDEPTDEPTDELTEAPTESQTEAPKETEAALPYSDSLGKIKASDFAWISDAQSGSLTGTFISNDDLVGRWKAEMIFDGIWELVYVTIDRDGTITVEPYKINYGDGWEDEDEDPYIFNGTFDVNYVGGSGQYGTMELYQFVENGGVQYGLGSFELSTQKVPVYLVRP